MGHVERGVAGQGAARRRQPHRRELILEAAKRLFAEQGYHETGMSEIGRAAGITGSAIYRHFESKDDLLVSLFDRLWDRIAVTMESIAGLPPRPALDALVRGHVALALEDGHIVDLWAQRRTSVPEHYLKAAERHLDHYLSIWARYISLVRPDVRPEEAYHMASAVIGAINAASYTPPKLPTAELGAALHRLAWGAMGATPSDMPTAEADAGLVAG
jgi:AcrR family transcriptional regulator